MDLNMIHADIFVYPPADVPETPLPPVAVGVIGLAHGHIYGMCKGLLQAGAQIKYVYDPESSHIAEFCKTFPGVQVCNSEEAVLEKNDIQLIASAAIPAQRACIGIRAMEAGKDFFVDKAPMTTLTQVDAVRETCQKTGKKYCVYYGESVTDPSAVYARALIRRGIIGNVIHVDGVAPHRLSPAAREPWFFRREDTGGILTDLVCHQIHQFLDFTNTNVASLDMGRVYNYHHPEYPDWDDFGDCAITAENGATGHFRVDWFTPDGRKSWGDGRILIVGTEGYIELRKNGNLTQDGVGQHVYVVTNQGEFCDNVAGKVEITYYRRLLWDCINRTETVTNFQRELQAITLAIEAQNLALAKTK